MCWGSMQINYTIKHWGWGDCCALPNSPKSREKLSPVIHYQCVFCRVNIEMCVPYLQWYYAGQQTYISERKKKKKRKSKKMTGFQATTISSDLTPCMLLPVVLSQQCRDLCWHGCHFCRACHSEAALSGCYHSSLESLSNPGRSTDHRGRSWSGTVKSVGLDVGAFLYV